MWSKSGQKYFIYQKYDEGNYGTRFPAIPFFVSNNLNTELLWIIVALRSRSKTLWEIVNKKSSSFRESEWEGWILCYEANKCFKNVTQKTNT